MTSTYKSLTSFFLILLLLNSVIPIMEIEARPLNIMKPRNPERRVTINGFLNGLQSIKDSGPSPGVGHKYADSHTLGLGGIKDSGPSPGQGH
ncbi:hypothetical protein HS088_TW01G00783 [Tripterygium wilfordii]|uniref:Transmembrane protein n=1 Tax=Tripterygium wilfordii TaxID=458696 RepID=A0A7J7E2P0_TRIWF|nr:hypothetical protein HS088_TW01G00783 [Tripterygium wilfordii]